MGAGRVRVRVRYGCDMVEGVVAGAWWRGRGKIARAGPEGEGVDAGSKVVLHES